jgi:hypothetical protein
MMFLRRRIKLHEVVRRGVFKNKNNIKISEADSRNIPTKYFCMNV